MNFLLGILLVIIIILLLYNFASISISNTQNAGKWSNNQNYLTTQQQLNILQTGNGQIPQPMLSNSNTSTILNKQPIYDYNKYFFVK